MVKYYVYSSLKVHKAEWEILENYTNSSNLTTSIMPLNYSSNRALLHALMGYFFSSPSLS